MAETLLPEADFEVCRRGETALQRLREQPAQLGLLGLNFDDIDGLDLLQRVLEESLIERLIIISSRKDERTLHLLRQLPINGFFDAAEDEEEVLHDAIWEVANGGSYYSPALRISQAGRFASVPTLHKILSETELHVLSVIADGSDDRQASGVLGLRPTTVHTHRRNIMRKLSVQTRAQLMRVAIQRGVVRFTAEKVIRPGFAPSTESVAT
jgi:DNA-binding NarL/FixJ family response regulator